MTGHDRADGIVVLRSNRAVGDAVGRLRALAGERGLKVFAEFDHAAAARSAGLGLPSTVVMVFGSPEAGTPLMKAAPLVALELPLKVLVWQASDGSTRLAYEDPRHLAGRFGVPEQLADNIAGIEALARAAAD
jgi:uncharacterized protein (DUF302 family)